MVPPSGAGENELRRAAILMPLAAAARCSRAAVRAAADALGLSERQVFVLVRRLRAANGDPAALRRGSSSGGRGQSRIAPETDQAIHQIIADACERGWNQPAAEIIAVIQRQCRDKQLPPPSASTVRRRFKMFDDRAQRGMAIRQRTEDTGSCAGDGDLLSSLYDTVGNPLGWEVFLRGLTAGSSFDRAMVSLYDGNVKKDAVDAHVNFDRSEADFYERHYAALNPWLQNPEKRPIGVVLTSEAAVPHADFLKTEFYNDYCRKQNFDIAVGLTIQEARTRSMVVSAVGLRADFERDKHLVGRLQRLAPHLLRVAQLNRQLGQLEARNMAAEASLDRLAMAMLVVDGTGQVVYLNATAERIIAAGDGIRIVRGMLDAADGNEGQALRQLVVSALQAPHDIAASPGGVMRVGRRSGERSYEVLVAPISNRTINLGLSGPMATVFVRGPAARGATPLAWLERLYSLTGAEARLMQALLAGDRLDTIAARFAITKETVRSQLKAVFGKTGTSSQLELLRLGLRGLGALGGSGENL